MRLDDMEELARDAYLYAYPLVLMDITMRQAVNVPDEVTEPMRAPVNRFAHVRTYPGAEDRDVVRFNFDTLYSFAWVDLTAEPVVFETPATGGRYFLTPIYDMWTDVFAVPGSRTTGNEAAAFLLTAPGWDGEIPEGLRRLAAPTPTVWIIARVQTDGPGDFAAVHAVQDGFALTPLGRWNSGSSSAPAPAPVDPSVDGRTPPFFQADALSGEEMLVRLSRLLAVVPPHPNDYPILHRLERFGIGAGKVFDPAVLDRPTREAIDRGAAAAKAAVLRGVSHFAPEVNGWMSQLENIGTYGTSYLKRAVVAAAGLGANLPEDAVYPGTEKDSDGELLTGDRRYVLRFDADSLPPARAFWSLTLYDLDGFQVPNALDRFAIGDRDELVYGEDGSLELYIQADDPGGEATRNWLPAPRGERFRLMLRVYSPAPAVTSGGWAAPPVRRR
ncbi:MULTISPECIES: DUF1254 domain-containing protein [Rhodococcus]|uniref:DUF1254 domain-containing protein n=1 Tax=Rhodococcus TaxID=1827 RepID=UPI00163A6D2C|nr:MULTISPECIES: DUF1254 domain-containing protein [Rhodococcus]MBC2590458.1 DUF1254 domain-containing protein [Rhodococcus aetherivorans]QRI76634.1 DUF1254 domain-containing protein [Rhodococcus aetherivorans]QSE60051.1 DUF1254 domain-containing protein [Rhodococcus sp. PSBB066]QSE68643.1 DUF1254 domain-containing protein [Rhodococcus sp. PSBB049]